MIPIENKMVVDFFWDWKEKQSGPGYMDDERECFIPEDDVMNYAVDIIRRADKELKKEFFELLGLRRVYGPD